MSYAHKAGSAGTVTIAAGKRVHCWGVHAAAGGAGGTLIITPGDGSAQETIPVPAGAGFGYTFPDNSPSRPGALGEGTTLVFAGTDMYLVIPVDA